MQRFEYRNLMPLPDAEKAFGITQHLITSAVWSTVLNFHFYNAFAAGWCNLDRRDSLVTVTFEPSARTTSAPSRLASEWLFDDTK